MKPILLALVVLAALAPLCGARAAVLPSPAAPSDTLRAAHPQPEGELRLRYQEDVDGAHAQPLIVTLARDYDVLETPTLRTIHDYTLRRVLSYQPAFIGTYSNDSLYADVWQRAAEVGRRSTAAGHVEQAGTGPVKGQLTLAPFWAESELGIIDPSYPRPLALMRSDTPDRTRWSLGGLEVLAVRWHPDALPAEVKNGLRRLWPLLAPVHPQIADELAATGRVPEELWVAAPDPGHKRLVRRHWRLLTSDWVPAAPYPLPARLHAAPTLATAAYPRVFATLTRAVDQKLTPPSQQTYMERIQSSISAGDGLAALVWQMEMRMASPEASPECRPNSRSPGCALGQLASSLAENDDRTEMALAPTSPPLKMRTLFTDLPNGYLLRLLWATRPPGEKVTPAESERGVLEALSASPVAAFTKSAGDFYASQWQPRAAWQVWDLGRLMAGHRPGDALAEIDALEQRLLSSYPEAF